MISVWMDSDFLYLVKFYLRVFFREILTLSEDCKIVYEFYNVRWDGKDFFCFRSIFRIIYWNCNVFIIYLFVYINWVLRSIIVVFKIYYLKEIRNIIVIRYIRKESLVDWYLMGVGWGSGYITVTVRCSEFYVFVVILCLRVRVRFWD